MNTVTFIGSDKNAGKTTAFNHIYGVVREHTRDGKRFCLTSTGISGDRIDRYLGHPKPRINVYRGTFVVTAKERIEMDQAHAFQVKADLGPPRFSRSYLLAKCTSDTAVVLEGPNTKQELISMKAILKKTIAPEMILVDGSADRQFVAHPLVSDSFFFAIRLSDNHVDMGRATAFLVPLNLTPCPSSLLSAISDHETTDDTKSLVFDHNLSLCYAGKIIPFQDSRLVSHLHNRKTQSSVLYLNGALSPTLFREIRLHRHLTVVLDNFTLYQAIPTQGMATPFLPALHLRYPVKINGMFIRNDTKDSEKRVNTRFPRNVPSLDLFKDTPKTVETVTNEMIRRILKLAEGV